MSDWTRYSNGRQGPPFRDTTLLYGVVVACCLAILIAVAATMVTP
jgi:hypothetical protein